MWAEGHVICALPPPCCVLPGRGLSTFLSLSVLVDKIELLRGLHKVIPEKKTCVEQWRAHSRSSIYMGFPGLWTVGWGGAHLRRLQSQILTPSPGGLRGPGFWKRLWRRTPTLAPMKPCWVTLGETSLPALAPRQLQGSLWVLLRVLTGFGLVWRELWDPPWWGAHGLPLSGPFQRHRARSKGPSTEHWEAGLERM